MRYCNMKTSFERSDVALVSTNGDRFEVRPLESEAARELIRLGSVSPRSLRRDFVVPFATPTLKYLLGLSAVSSCVEEEQWFELEKVIEEISPFATHYPKIQSVCDSIAEHMLTTLCDDNCFLLHKKLREFHCQRQADKALEYIKYNLIRMVIFERTVDVEFFRLPAEDLKVLLDSDDVNLEREVHIAEVVNRWISADYLKRERFRPMLFSTVRLMSLPEPTAGIFADYSLSMKLPRKTRDVLLVVGGWLHKKACDRIEWLDPEAGTWHVSAQKLPLAVAYHGAVILDNHLYVFGGSNGQRSQCETWKVSPTTWKWQRCDNMLEPRNYISNSSVVFDGKIYVFGGQNWREISRPMQRSRTGEMYDPGVNRWLPTASLQDMRSDCAAAVFGNQIYVSGGFNGDILIASVEVYNPAADQFVRLVDLPLPLSGHCMVVHSDSLLIVGGFNGAERQKKILLWQKTTGEWTEQEEHLVVGRSTSSVCSYMGTLVAVGGYTRQVERTCVTLLAEPDARLRAVPPISRAKSALRSMVAPNWRDHLERRGAVTGNEAQSDMEGESEEEDEYATSSAASVYSNV